MRGYRTLVATATACAVCIGPFMEAFSVGALIGLVICGWLWRFELKAWWRETWKRLLEALRA